MEPIYSVDIKKIKRGELFEFRDNLIREIKLEIVLNGKKMGAVMATPVDQEALAVGYLMSESIIDDVDSIKSIKLSEEGMRVEITADANQKNIDKLDSEGVIISGCGKGMSANVEPDSIEAKIIKSDFKLDASLLFEEMSKFYTECPLYEQTGCVHTAKLYIDEEIHFVGEDIAQHNTIDKAVGKAKMAGYDTKRSFLMVSGRLSSEMVAKAVMHRIPILASRTATTCLGYKVAKKFNLTLLGFVRGEGMNIYTEPRRINV